MIVSHSKKLIFIHVHRTAGTSFSNMLRQHLGGDMEEFSQHSNAKTLDHDLFENYHDYYKFGFVRNPWERIFSWFALIHGNKQQPFAQARINFENFLEDDQASDFSTNFFHYNALDYFTNHKGELIVDYIGRYENLNNEINTILNQFNFPLTEIPHVNVASPKDYKRFYRDKSHDLIAEKCKKDIAYFNYRF